MLFDFGEGFEETTVLILQKFTTIIFEALFNGSEDKKKKTLSAKKYLSFVSTPETNQRTTEAERKREKRKEDKKGR